MPCHYSRATRPVSCLFTYYGNDVTHSCIVLTARDAWIQADVNRFGGANRCTLWTAFASRGLGVNAANHNNDATVPDDC